MKIEVNEALTRQVAHLSRLALTDQEVEIFTPQLKEILSYVELLQSVDVEGVEPLTHPLELMTPLREDEVRPAPKDAEGLPKVLTSAPQVLNSGFKVPQVL